VQLRQVAVVSLSRSDSGGRSGQAAQPEEARSALSGALVGQVLHDPRRNIEWIGSLVEDADDFATEPSLPRHEALWDRAPIDPAWSALIQPPK